MLTKRVLSVSAAGIAATVCLTGCGAAGHAVADGTNRTVVGHPAADHTSVVYQWGQFGGGQPVGASARADVVRRLGGSPFGVGSVIRRPEVVHGIDGTVVQVATSNSNSYALTRSGAVYAWGPGSQGELGNGALTTLSRTAVRVALPAGVRIRSLPNPMPYDGGMAIGRDGTVWAWGNDRSRDFCTPHGAILRRPVKVDVPGPVTLAVGALRHAEYDAHGHILSCGAGPNGQLGDGTRGIHADTGTPVAVRGLPRHGHAVTLTAAWGNAGVQYADGRYYDWGFNAGGQVGDGTRRIATTAARVDLPHRVRRVFEGGSYANNGQTMAILANGSLWEWGNGAYGQLGDGRTADALRPFRLRAPRGVRFTSVSSGGSTNYAIDRRGRLWSWGNNLVDQVGNGSSRRLVLVPARDSIRVAQVTSTAHNVAALGVNR